MNAQNSLPITTLRNINVKRQLWERNKQICDLLITGLPLEQIGDIHGITRQRVDQIRKQYKLEQKTPEAWAREKMIADDYLSQNFTLPDLAERYQTSEDEINQLISDFHLDITKPLKNRHKLAIERSPV